MKKINYVLLLLLTACLFACEEEIPRFSIDNDNVPPPALAKEDVIVTSIAGGAIINYIIPEVEDVAGVEMRYTTSSGEKYVKQGSMTSEELIVAGFTKGEKAKVSLYVFDRALNYSAPLEVEIVADRSAIEEAVETFACAPTFGGFYMTWENSEKADIVLSLTYVDEIGDTVELGGANSNYYSTAEAGEYAIRNLDTVYHDCFVQFRDRWMNYSPKLSFKGTPLFEKEFRESITVMGEEYANNLNPTGGAGGDNADGFQEVWFKEIVEPSQFYPIVGTSRFPWYVSFDMGEKVVVSRLVSWQYAFGDWFYYRQMSLRTYDWYGSNDPSHDMSNWTHLARVDMEAPSGKHWPLTPDPSDIAFAKAGQSTSMPVGLGGYRYYRLEALRNWETSTVAFGALAKFAIWGDVAKD